MGYQSVFRRYELKYLLTRQQKQLLLQAMEPYMRLDKYGRATIRNIYFDTENYRLIRRSLERPAYKEKLRIRSYERANEDSSVFVELKKKYKGVVYKRRIEMPERQALSWLCESKDPPVPSQIAEEIDYFCRFYGSLRPTTFLSYEREAYYSLSGDSFRVTFDENILSRETDISLHSDIYGTPLLPEDMVLMELKTSGGIPLWMTRLLTENRIFKTSFSKYGTAYRNLILTTPKGEHHYA